MKRQSSRPPPRSAPARDRLIGREEAAAQLTERLAQGAPIVTIVGVGGVGKTRLAKEAVLSKPRTIFCDVTAATDESALVLLVARACNVSLGTVRGHRVIVEAIARALLQSGTITVVLDNFEQVIEPGAALLLQLVEKAPNVQWLVTSREALRLDCEEVVRLEPLPTTAVDGALSPAAELFIGRASRSCSPVDIGLVNEIVRRVDGIPLAIELAAARTNVLSLAELLARLGDSMNVLAQTRRDAPNRHLRLSDTIRWSWDLLSEEERRTLLGLSVFSGSFSLEAAEHVLARTRIESEAVDAIASLVDKSLVQSRVTTSGARYLLLETIRAFVRSLPDADGVRTGCLARHTAYFVDFAEARMRDSGGKPITTLDVEEDNLNDVAFRLRERCSDDAGAPALALRMLVALGTLRRIRYPIVRYSEELEQVFAHLGPSSVVPAGLRAEGLEQRAYCQLELGEPARSRALYDEALAYAKRAIQPRTEARCLIGLGRLEANQGVWTGALVRFARARELALELEDKELEILADACTELYGSELGTTSLSAERAARDYFTETGDPLQAIYWGIQYGRGLVDYGSHEAAVPVLEELVRAARGCGDLRGEGLAHFGLGTALLALSRYREAKSSLQIAVETLQRVGAARYDGYASGYLAIAHHGLGEAQDAERVFAHAILFLDQTGDRPNAALFRGCRAGAFAASDRVEEAETELRLAESMMGSEIDIMRQRAFFVLRGQIDLALARRARAQGDDDRASTHAEAARERLTRATTPTERALTGGYESWIEQSFEPCVAVGMLRQTLSAWTSSSANTWMFFRDARAFRPPSGEWLSVERRRPLRRVLHALVQRRFERPGELLSAETLIDAGWPGERLTLAAARNRLYVAIDALKKVGLQDLLERGVEGWRLDPRAPVAWQHPAPN